MPIILSPGRNWYILGSLEAMIDEHVKDAPRSSRPALLDLERNASLGLHFGHPFLMDGLRPVAPNFVFVGMMKDRAAMDHKLIVSSFHH